MLELSKALEPDSPQSAERRFKSLAAEWKSSATASSSVARLAMHPAYQQIIGMGKPALPLILRELEHVVDHWFPALFAITGIDPVPAESRGRLDQIAQAWLSWGRKEGLLK